MATWDKSKRLQKRPLCRTKLTYWGSNTIRLLLPLRPKRTSSGGKHVFKLMYTSDSLCDATFRLHGVCARCKVRARDEHVIFEEELIQFMRRDRLDPSFLEASFVFSASFTWSFIYTCAYGISQQFSLRNTLPSWIGGPYKIIVLVALMRPPGAHN